MLEITLFGPTVVVLPDGTRLTADELGGVKSRQILELLALTPGIPISKEQLAERLWDGHPPRTYLATVESYVSVLRRALHLPRGRASALATTSRGYVLHADRVRVDVVEVRRRLREARGGDTTARHVELAARMAAAPLLASDTGAEWAASERADLCRALVDGCSRAAEQALADGEVDVALRLATTATDLDPLAESAVRTIMLARQASGCRADALRAYGALRVVLAEELGLEPAPETHDVYMQVLLSQGPLGGRDPRGEARQEVRALLGLLRQVLDSVPGMELPTADRSLAEAARSMVKVA
ncbi:MAG: BTAD domain-containing putative transcriptional regulator [Actinomycetes bacterium]